MYQPLPHILKRRKMAVQKIITDDNNPNKHDFSYDEWINANLKNICNYKSGRINYVNRKNKPPNKYETEEIINKLDLHDLADADALSATLRPFGEQVCKAGGWLKHLEIKQQVSTLKEFSQTQKENLEIELAKSNIEANKLNAEIAAQNKKDRFSNKVATWLNVIVGIINLSIIIWQLLKTE
jgi:hypothetical protein